MVGEQMVAAVRRTSRPVGLDPAQISAPALRSLYDYWLDKWQGDRMPARADIEPLEIPGLLPQVYLVDVEHDPLGLRFRLVGTRIVAWFGRDVTGEAVGEDLVGRYREAVESAQPVYDCLSLPGKTGRQGAYQRLVLPLAGADGRVEMLLGGVQPTPVPI